MGSDYFDPLGDDEAGVVGADDEHAQPARSLAIAGAREHGVEVRNPPVGDIGFLAVEDVRAAVRACRHGNVGGVASSCRFGHREGGDGAAGRDLGQPLGFLLRRSGEADCARAQALHREGEIGETRVIGQGLAGNGEAADVGNCIGADAQIQETSGTEIADKLAAGGVDIGIVVGAEVGAGPLTKLRGQIAVALVIKRPGETHQLPLNSGFRFAAKAS